MGKDLAQAITWWRKASRQGNAQAQLNLGNIHLKGEGTDKDYKQAVIWYRLAADQGLAEAQYALGMRHMTGEGVEKDEIEAYAYCRLASGEVKGALEKIAALEKKLSGYEIAAGQRRCKELQEEIEAKGTGK